MTPHHCDKEIDCMEYPSYCEDNEIPCPLHNCKKRNESSLSKTPAPAAPEQHPFRKNWVPNYEPKDECDACNHDMAQPCQLPPPCQIGDDPCVCLESICDKMKEHDAAIVAATLERERARNVFVIKLDSSEYINPNSDDEELSKKMLWNIRVITLDEDASYILLEEQYLRLESAIKRWVKKTFQRINNEDGIKTTSLRTQQHERGDPR